jgi:hypothetical protein
MIVGTRWLGAASLLLFASLAVAQEASQPQVARGVVVKATKDSLTIKPRDAGGKFLPDLRLKLTGTSKISTLSSQTRAGKAVLTQKDTDPTDLQPNQPIAAVYASAGSESVLLTAVVVPGK